MFDGATTFTIRLLISVALTSVLASSPAIASLRMNEIQALGTHNSYHLKSASAAIVRDWNYSHAALAVQLSGGVRQIELDVHLKDDGRFYVHHVAHFDEKSTCALLTECLEQIHTWSKANPTHIPVLVWFEIKDKDFDRYLEHWRVIGPHLRELEAVVKKYFADDELITPDLIRGEYATVPDAIRAKGWPEIDSVRGRIAFALLGSDFDYRSYYGEPMNIANRIFFANVHDGFKNPVAAFFKPDDPVKQFDFVKMMVRDGFIATVIADQPQNSVLANQNRERYALASGAQYISTNFQRQVTKGFRFNPLPMPVCNPFLKPTDCETLEYGH